MGPSSVHVERTWGEFRDTVDFIFGHVQSCVSASFVVTIALNTSSPTALAYVIALFFALPQLPAMLLLSERIEEKLHALLEPHLWTIMNLVLSIRGQLLVAGGLLLFSLLILFAGVQLFSSKRSYV